MECRRNITMSSWRWTLPALVLSVLACLVWNATPAQGHGRLMEPPSRSSMWRFGFKTPPNYNDNELFCGGYAVHWQQNGGKCGVCGDPWHQRQPRNNEAGGKYAKGIIVRRYKRGDVMKASVQLTANHRGFFEFRLCPVNDPKVAATDECMSKHPLTMADDASGSTRYMVDPRKRDFNLRLKLPEDMTCSQCVLQWSYTAGNNWGKCANGSSAVGCGPQETFRGCADIAIEDDVAGGEGGQGGFDNGAGDVPAAAPPRVPATKKPVTPQVPWWVKGGPKVPVTPKKQPPHRGYPWKTVPTRRPYHEVEGHTKQVPAAVPAEPRPVYPGGKPEATTTTEATDGAPTQGYPEVEATSGNLRRSTRQRTSGPPPRRTPRTSLLSQRVPAYKPGSAKEVFGGCKGVGMYKRIPGLDKWCWDNCHRGYCPPTHCTCH
ncbi:hypothetical protein HPB50_024974 [Hyalomma asiaticum]|uniref:Uncharacterized protein n=1 Tax=Hyalomma asiaticum TaxID=266040 RepID=A0ACB7RWU7_HYAAI|nr:hypothetical protein HPB50_024974 [Hyalomma asiaticum]